MGTWDEIADKLYERYGRIVTHAEFSIAVRSEADRIRLTMMVERLRTG